MEAKSEDFLWSTTTGSGGQACSSGSLDLFLGVHTGVIKPGVASEIRGKPNKTCRSGCHANEAGLVEAGVHMWVRTFVTVTEEFSQGEGAHGVPRFRPHPIPPTQATLRTSGTLGCLNPGKGLVQMRGVVQSPPCPCWASSHSQPTSCVSEGSS